MSEEKLEHALTKVLAPMIGSDEGELFLVKNSDALVHVHLRGRFAGCPGNGLVLTHVITPLIHSVRPDAKIEMTSGPIVPVGAVPIAAVEVEDLTQDSSGDKSEDSITDTAAT